MNGKGQMHLDNDVKLDFSDVLLRPKRSTIESRGDVDLSREFKFRNGGTWKGIPIISSNMTSVTNGAAAAVMSTNGMLAVLPKNVRGQIVIDMLSKAPFNHGNLTANIMPSFGISVDLAEAKGKWVCLDIANGYIENFVNLVKIVRANSPNTIIVAGNVVTPEMTEALILAGADVVKVGIGGGSACATRIVTGVGYPQLSAVMECADAAHGLGGHIISDGGCVEVGDIVKAFAGGADFVMLGGMLAGHDENGTEFYGMASERGNNLLAGGLKDYKASEGFEINLKPRGPLKNTLQNITGGLRSACAYIGAKRLKDLPKCATFVRVNRIANQSLWEYRV